MKQNHRLVALYDIRSGNGIVPFLPQLFHTTTFISGKMVIFNHFYFVSNVPNDYDLYSPGAGMGHDVLLTPHPQLTLVCS